MQFILQPEVFSYPGWDSTRILINYSVGNYSVNALFSQTSARSIAR